VLSLKNPGSSLGSPHLSTLAHDAKAALKKKTVSNVASKPTQQNFDEVFLLHKIQSHLNRLGGLVAKCKICEDRCLEYSRTQGEPYRSN